MPASTVPKAIVSGTWKTDESGTKAISGGYDARGRRGFPYKDGRRRMLAQSSCPDAKPVKTRHIHRMAKSPEITRKELLHGAQKAVASLKKRFMDRIAETRRRGRAARQKDRNAR